jgi:DNA-binding response OmpR family regulator
MMAEARERLLVVDDNEMNRDMLSRRLQRQGYEVTVAEHGVRALELMRANDYDLVLLDVMMPQLNGYEVLEEVKQDERLRHVPIIMISAMDDLDSVVKCIELGAEDYLFKPFNPVLLKARVRSSLDKMQLRHEGGPVPTVVNRNVGMSSSSQSIRMALSNIHGAAQGLVSGDAGPLNDDQTDLINRILTDLDNLNTLLGV